MYAALGLTTHLAVHRQLTDWHRDLLGILAGSQSVRLFSVVGAQLAHLTKL